MKNRQQIRPGTVARLLDPAALSADLAVMASGLRDAARVKEMLAGARVTMDAIENADISETERVSRMRALDDKIRPVLARIGVVWNSHVVARKVRS